MKYISTRGNNNRMSFEQVLLAGLAPDGGLYIPESMPNIKDRLLSWQKLNYSQLTFEVIRLFTGDTYSDEQLKTIINQSYQGFDTPAICPLQQTDHNSWLLELYHGPTLAFKDIALQCVGRMIAASLKKSGRLATVLAATSGDTGSAAIAALKGEESVQVFMLHPQGKVSDVQRRQMTTADYPNIHNIAIEGTFDDCQNLVKQLFNQADFRSRVNLSAVNSINWARIAFQTVYYIYAALSLGAPNRKIDFVVPTGNFGNIYAAYITAKMGLPINRLIIASNENDILTRGLANGDYSRKGVIQTASNAMDIQISSNFERLLFDLWGGDGTALAINMAEFEKSGRLTIPAEQRLQAAAIFDTARASDTETKAMMRDFYKTNRLLIDPHTAVGLVAASKIKHESDVARICLAPAHPAKFPDIVFTATGILPPQPDQLAVLAGMPEYYDVLPNNPDRLMSYILTLNGDNNAN